MSEQELNNIYGLTRFTYEYEQNNTINVLNTTITRMNKNNQTKMKNKHENELSTHNLSLDYCGDCTYNMTFLQPNNVFE